MTPGHAALYRCVAERYRGCGRFAFHYVGNKLRRDPLSAALLDMGAERAFGEVADLGCGRGQFAALLLEAGLARRVTGLDASPALLDQARTALRDVPFDARLQDFTQEFAIPDADTVLLLDVLYQLPTATQQRLLAASAAAARRQVIVRAADPSRSLRAWLTRTLEASARRVWPHSGAMVNARPVAWIAGLLTSSGLSVSVAPCWAGTPFSNVLLVARRDP